MVIAAVAGTAGRALSATAGHTVRLGVPGVFTGNHRAGYADPIANGCIDCHGADLAGDPAPSCYKCHGGLWDPGLPRYPDSHVIDIVGNGHGAPQPNCTLCHSHGGPAKTNRFWHAPGHLTPFWSQCGPCHGANLDGVNGFAISCYSCHDRLWAGQGPPPDHTDIKAGFAHRPGAEDPSGCMTCHGDNLSSGFIPSCFQCHGPGGGLPTDHTVTISGFSHKPGYTLPWESGCTDCHGPNLNDGWAPSCFSCHPATWDDHDFSDRPWLGGTNPCYVCHLPPAFDPGSATSAPDWNHAPAPVGGYTVTTSTLSSVGQPAGVSLKCMGCHAGDPDGAGGNPPAGPAVDDFGGGPAVPSEWVTGNNAFGFDLSQHHPVSFFYDAGLAGIHGGLYDPASAPSGLTRTGTIAQDMLDETGQLECTACHNQHKNTYREYLVNPKGSLCFTCHKLQAGEGMHHIPGRDAPWQTFRCSLCHGSALDGTPDEGGDGVAPACTSCHNDFAAPNPPPPGHHGGERTLPYVNCAACHADPVTGVVTGNRFGTAFAPSCYRCHDDLWNVGNQAPLNVAMADLSGIAGQAITFDASHIIDPEEDPLAMEWGFGDGSSSGLPSHQSTTTHAYAEFGTYTATLAVTDGVNSPQFVQFQVVVSPATADPVADAWTVEVSDATPVVVEAFGMTFQNHSGSLVGVKDDGSLSFGVEFVGVIFWMDVWMDLSGNVFWGTGDMFFGNIDRQAGTMSGVVFDEEGGVHSFTGNRSP